MKKELLSDLEELTIQNYDQLGALWYNQKLKRFRDYVIRFKELLPTGRVLELGFGNGDDAAALIENGFDYEGVEVSKTLLEMAKARLPTTHFSLQSLYQLSFEKESFDGFWAAAVLLHIPKEKISTALREINRVCKKGAIGFIVIKGGEGEAIEADDFPNGAVMKRFFAYYSLKEFQEALEKNGFEIVEAAQKQGTTTLWLTYFVKKAQGKPF